ncbi:hypothetical protein COBT_000020 [Conglomerata obtusa]
MSTPVTIQEYHPDTALFPPCPGKLFTISYKSNKILVEPFANMKNIHEIGINLFNMLKHNIKEVNETNSIDCVIEKYTREVFVCENVYVKIEEVIDIRKILLGIRFINLKSSGPKWEIIGLNYNKTGKMKGNSNTDQIYNFSQLENQVNNLDMQDVPIFYEVTENTKILYTNTDATFLNGYSGNIKLLESKINTSLVHNKILETNQLPTSNILFVTGNKEVKKKQVCQQSCFLTNTNHLHVDAKKHPEVFIDACSIKNDKLMIVLENCFNNESVHIKPLCKHINDFVQINNNILFVLLVEAVEDDIEQCFDVFVERVKLDIPILDKNGRIFKGLIRNVKNKLSEREIKKISSICEGQKINEMERILKEVIDAAVYENGEEYCVSLEDFMTIFKRRKMIKDSAIKSFLKNFIGKK